MGHPAKAKSVEQDLKKLGSKEKSESSQWFFKTGKGQYGYGDVFIGVTVPEQRKVAKKYADLALPDIENLLSSKFHECRLTALLILCSQYKKAEEKTQKTIVKFYLSHLERVNNWDLVDTSARNILGEYLVDKDRSWLYKLARSQNIWERRVAIVATHAFIVRHDFDDTLAIATILLDDTHDLIHKAVGWMLREVGKRSRPALITYLNEYSSKMPRTALRYAIEHFPEAQRKRYMAKK